LYTAKRNRKATEGKGNHEPHRSGGDGSQELSGRGKKLPILPYNFRRRIKAGRAALKGKI